MQEAARSTGLTETTSRFSVLLKDPLMLEELGLQPQTHCAGGRQALPAEPLPFIHHFNGPVLLQLGIAV